MSKKGKENLKTHSSEGYQRLSDVDKRSHDKKGLSIIDKGLKVHNTQKAISEEKTPQKVIKQSKCFLCTTRA